MAKRQANIVRRLLLKQKFAIYLREAKRQLLKRKLGQFWLNK